MKKAVSVSIMIKRLDVFYDNGECVDFSKNIIAAIRIYDDFEFVKDGFGVDCLVEKNNGDKSLLHLLRDAQQVILNNAELLEIKHGKCVELDKIKSALRKFKKPGL